MLAEPFFGPLAGARGSVLVDVAVVP